MLVVGEGGPTPPLGRQSREITGNDEGPAVQILGVQLRGFGKMTDQALIPADGLQTEEVTDLCDPAAPPAPHDHSESLDALAEHSEKFGQKCIQWSARLHQQYRRHESFIEQHLTV